MNKIKKSMAFMSLCLLLTACGGGEGVKVIESPSPSPTTNPKMINSATPSESQTPPDEPIEDLYPDSGYTFSLSENEKEVYEKLKAELTTDVFEGLEPAAVAKIYIQCGIDGEWEAEYTCHSQDGLETTKEKWHEKHIEDMKWSVLESRQSLANWQFPFIGEGEVTIDGDKAVIVYYSVPDDEDEAIEDTYNEFHLIKNSKGIWEVRFRPQLID